MSSLDVEVRVAIMTVVKKTILDKVNSYLNIDDCDLDMKEFEILKNTFDALCDDRPVDMESRIYVKTLAADKLADGLNVLRSKVYDDPELRSDVNELLNWFHVAKDI